MSKTAWIIIGVIEAVAAIAIVAISAIMGGCDHVLETTSGGTCFMKCHWTFIATAILGVALGVRIASVVAAICSIIQLIKANPEATKIPKMKL